MIPFHTPGFWPRKPRFKPLWADSGQDSKPAEDGEVRGFLGRRGFGYTCNHGTNYMLLKLILAIFGYRFDLGIVIGQYDCFRIFGFFEIFSLPGLRACPSAVDLQDS
jgi:hypothetical protein